MHVQCYEAKVWPFIKLLWGPSRTEPYHAVHGTHGGPFRTLLDLPYVALKVQRALDLWGVFGAGSKDQTRRSFVYPWTGLFVLTLNSTHSTHWPWAQLALAGSRSTTSWSPTMSTPGLPCGSAQTIRPGWQERGGLLEDRQCR